MRGSKLILNALQSYFEARWTNGAQVRIRNGKRLRNRAARNHLSKEIFGVAIEQVGQINQPVLALDGVIKVIRRNCPAGFSMVALNSERAPEFVPLSLF